jgi:hypothetical protein
MIMPRRRFGDGGGVFGLAYSEAYADGDIGQFFKFRDKAFDGS